MTEETLRMVVLERLQTVWTPEFKEMRDVRRESTQRFFDQMCYI